LIVPFFITICRVESCTRFWMWVISDMRPPWYFLEMLTGGRKLSRNLNTVAC
jgi:hypothetical protein